jgi:rhamnogalacturonyl hydrolase YesR
MVENMTLCLFKNSVFRLAVTLSIVLTLSFAGSCSRQSGIEELVSQIELSNPSQFERRDEPLLFEFESLGLAPKDPIISQLIVRTGQNRLPGQLVDIDGDTSDDGIMTLVDLKPAETRQIEIAVNTSNAGNPFKKRTQAEISVKQGGEWKDNKYIGGTFVNVDKLIPPPQHTDHSEYIRYEGPGIESDKVGYRIYLDWRNGFDIYGKKTRDLVLQHIGLDGYDSYHEMSDWGMDLLKVGDALGVGGFGYWNGKSVERVSKVDGWETVILENGDIYSSIKITYKGWQVADRKIDVTAILSMVAGSRLVNVKLEASETIPNFAIGLVKHEGTKFSQGDANITGKAWTYTASYGAQSLSGDNLGMALLFKRENRDAQTMDEHNYVSIMDPVAGNKLEYYFLAAWESEPEGISNEQDFIRYLEQESERLTVTPRQRLTTRHSVQNKQFPITAERALEWSQKMAESELARGTPQSLAYGGFDALRQRQSNFEYTTGLLMQAFDDLADATGNQGYAKIAEQVIGSFITDSGDIHTYKESEYNIDSINPGKMILRLYNDTGDERFKKAALQLRHQLENHPRTSEGAFWHKKRYPYQVWLDGVYMGIPFLTHHSTLFEDGASLQEAVNEFNIVRKYLYDSDTGLYRHAWDEKKVQDWADPETGLSKYFWGRGLGWYAMALVDTLDYIPADKPEFRQPLLDLITELAPAIISFQDRDSGVWYQILDQPEREGNYREATASSMFVYMLAKAINKGYLPDRYKDAALKGYTGLISEFVNIHSDGSISLTGNCSVAGLGYGRDGSYLYYMSEPIVDNDPKGVGPFIMAGIEVSKLID